MRILKTNVLLRFVNSYIVDSPQPANLSYLWNFGSLLALCLIIQILTGCFLAMHYIPNVDYAFNSVEHIMRDVENGYILRYTHANVASFFFTFVYAHIGRGLWYGSYRSPRVLLWSIGVIILVLMIAIGFLGYLYSPKWFNLIINNIFTIRLTTPIAHMLISTLCLFFSLVFLRYRLAGCPKPENINCLQLNQRKAALLSISAARCGGVYSPRHKTGMSVWQYNLQPVQRSAFLSLRLQTQPLIKDNPNFSSYRALSSLSCTAFCSEKSGEASQCSNQKLTGLNTTPQSESALQQSSFSPTLNAEKKHKPRKSAQAPQTGSISKNKTLSMAAERSTALILTTSQAVRQAAAENLKNIISNRLTEFLIENELNPVFSYEDLQLDEVRKKISFETRNLSGVYMVLNKVTLDFYIGSASTGKIYSRFYRHLISFNGSKIVKFAVKKYKLTSFAFLILKLFPEIVTKDNNNKLIALEDFYLKTMLPNYNILTEAGSSFGYKHTEITRLNMSKNYSLARKEWIKNLNKGKTLSPETIEKIRERALNRKPLTYSIEALANMKKKSKPIILYNLDRTVYGEFSGISEAAKTVGCDIKTINRALKTEKKILKRRYIVKLAPLTSEPQLLRLSGSNSTI